MEEDKIDGRSRQARSVRNENLNEKMANEPVGDTKRNPRVSYQAGGKLNIPPGLIKPGYRGYWQTEDKVEATKLAWYELVTDANGNHVTVPASKKDNSKLYLMQIEEKFFLEDMKKIQDDIDDKELGLATVGRGEYSPSDGRSGEGFSLRRERDVY